MSRFIDVNGVPFNIARGEYAATLATAPATVADFLPGFDDIGTAPAPAPDFLPGFDDIEPEPAPAPPEVHALRIITTGNGYFRAGLYGFATFSGFRNVFTGSPGNETESRVPEYTVLIDGSTAREFCQSGRDFEFHETATAPPVADTLKPATVEPPAESDNEPEPAEPDCENENATLPEFWQRETQLQAFARELDENGTAGYCGNVWTIRPNGNAFEFTRTQPNGETSTVVRGRYGFTFESYGRVLDYIVQNARREFVIEPEETANGCTIETRYHKRRGTNVCVVIMPEPLGKRFASEKQRAKRSGGWYAREFKPEHVSGGFMFLKNGDAREFANGFRPATARNNSPEETRSGVQHIKPAPAERSARPRTLSEPEKRAARFRELAEKLEKHIAHDSRPMTQNPTQKRLREYGYRIHRARNNENTRDALQALAFCLETDGTFPAWLQALKTTASVAELVSERWDGSRDCSTGEYHNATETGRAVQFIMEQWRERNRNPEQFAKREREQLEREILALSQKQIPGFYQTPRSVVQSMLNHADIEPGNVIGETSAGAGAIADAIRDAFGESVSVQCWETSGALRSILERKRHTLTGSDFLETEPGSVAFDRVVINPPFERGQDFAHVSRAFDMLKPGGRLVAIVANGAGFARFADLLDEFGEFNEALPAGTFNTIESINTTNVSARLIVLAK